MAGAGAAEATDEAAVVRKHRGFIFAMIGDLSATFGFVFGGLVPLLLLLCFHQNEKHYEAVWRISLGLGLIPPLSIFWFRYRMAVSTAYKKSSAKKQRVPYWPIFKRYWRPLLGCSISWFLYNYISYPFGIFASTILTRLNVGSSLIKNMGYGTVIVRSVFLNSDREDLVCEFLVRRTQKPYYFWLILSHKRFSFTCHHS